MNLDRFNLKKRMSKSNTNTVGSVLRVGLPLLGINALEAKIDTGAFSGALHAGNIHEVKNHDGQMLLKFETLGSKQPKVTVSKYHKRKVKSSNGHIDLRYAFDTEIEILGKCYPITITLSDRSSMKYPMLIGRSFLQTHGFLVDVSINNQ